MKKSLSLGTSLALPPLTAQFEGPVRSKGACLISRLFPTTDLLINEAATSGVASDCRKISVEQDGVAQATSGTVCSVRTLAWRADACLVIRAGGQSVVYTGMLRRKSSSGDVVVSVAAVSQSTKR